VRPLVAALPLRWIYRQKRSDQKRPGQFTDRGKDQNQSNYSMPNQAPETSVLCSVWIVAGFGRSRWPWTDVVAADWVATPPSPKMSKRGGCQLAASPPPIPFALSVPSGRPPKRGVSCGGRLARSSLAQPSAAAAPPPGSCLPALPRRRRPTPPPVSKQEPESADCCRSWWCCG
jgi:hypothetical protein